MRSPAGTPAGLFPFVAFRLRAPALKYPVMKALRHPLLGAILALVLILTGQSMAVMRMMPGPTGEMVLCTGTGPITVLTDENGQPVGPPHICPDCAMSMMAAHWDTPTQPLRPMARHVPLRPGTMALPRTAAAPSAQARGPPVLS